MKRLRSILPQIVFVLILALIGRLTWASTYYVNCTTGDDAAGNGSVNAPWKTMMKAEGSAANADTVHVTGGPCVENDATVHCLAAAKAIAWIADTSTTIQGHGSGNCTIRANTAQNVSFSGFTIDGDTKTNPIYKQGTGQYTFTGCTYSGASSGEWVNNIGAGAYNFQNGTVTATSTGGGIFYLAGPTSVSITGNTINTSVVNQELVYYQATGTLTFSNNNVTLTGTNPRLLWTDGNSLTTVIADSNTITASDVSNVLIKVAGNAAVAQSATITNNTINTSAANQVNAPISLQNATTSIVSGNTIDTRPSVGQAAFIVTSAGLDVTATLTNNTIYSTNNSSHTISVGTETSGGGDNHLAATITGNTIYGALYYNPSLGGAGTNHAIFYGHGVSATIARNTVYGSAGYCIVAKHSGGNFTTGGIYDNLCINSNAKSDGIFTKGINNVPVYNNTIFLDSSFSSALAAIRVGPNGASNSTGSIFKNNIVWSRDGSNLVNIEAGSSATMDYNLYWNHAGSGMDYLVGATAYTSFANWQAAGYDASGASANPLFRGSTNFRLTGGSPARVTGVDVGLTTDLDGKAFANPPSMGAYEYYSAGVINLMIGRGQGKFSIDGGSSDIDLSNMDFLIR